MTNLSATYLGIFCLFASGCAEVAYPEHLNVTDPINVPKQVATPVSEALICIDEKIAKSGGKFYVTAIDVPNLSGKGGFTNGAKEMLITALSKMSAKNKAIHFISYTQATAELVTLNNAHPESQNFKVPDYFIRGGVTQINKSAWSAQAGMGVSIEDQIGDESGSEEVGSVHLDLSLGDISSLSNIPGMYSSNKLSIATRSGGAIDFDFMSNGQAIAFRLGATENYSLDDAIRTLIELGAFELVAKFFEAEYGINYDDCVTKLNTSFAPSDKKASEIKRGPARQSLLTLFGLE